LPKTKFLKFFRVLPIITKVGISVFVSWLKGYRFRCAETENDLNKIFKIRYEVYRESGYIPENLRHEFRDLHDQCSINFLATDRKGNIIGAMRLTKHSPLALPAEHYFNINLDIIDKTKAVEPSRLVVKKELRKGNRFITLGLGVVAYQYSKKHNIQWWVATLPEKLANSLKRDFKINFSLILSKEPTPENLESRKEIQGYFDKKNLQPYIIDLQEMT